MNARSQFSPPFQMDTPHMAPPKRLVCEKRRRRRKKCFSRIVCSWQSSIVQVHAWRSDTVTALRFLTEIMDQYIYIICQYIDQARVWNDVLLQGLYSSGLSPVISGNRQWTWANCPEGEGRLHIGSCIGYNSAWSIDRCWQLSNTCSLQLGHCWVFCGVRCCRLVLYTVQV